MRLEEEKDPLTGSHIQLTLIRCLDPQEDAHASSTEHIGIFSVQCIAIENNPLLKLRLFGNSLSRQAFNWYTNLPGNSIQTWEHMENSFHDYYFIIQPEVTMSDLAALKPSKDEPAQDFITRKRFDGVVFGDFAKLADKASKYEELLREDQ
ncbi:unnamed protein product [Prunus armeniaca]